MGPALGRAASLLREAALVPLLVSPDADSVLAAGLLGLALHRGGVPWHARFGAEAGTLGDASPGQPVLLVGLGGRGAGEGEVVVLDAAEPRIAPARGLLLEPAGPATTATMALALARELDPRAPALHALAGLEAVGPFQGAEGLRAQLLEEAARQGARAGPVPSLPPGPLVEALAGCVEPFLPGLSGRARAAKQFLEGLGLPPSAPAEELAPEPAERLASALTLHLLSKGAPALAAAPLLTPDALATHPGGSARGLARLCAACSARPSLALTLALGDPRGEREALALAEARQQRLLQTMLKLEADGAPGAEPLRADADLAADLAWAVALSLRGGDVAAVQASPTLLHVAASGAEPRFLGQAAWETGRAFGGSGRALGHRAVVEVAAGQVPAAWAQLQGRLEGA